MQISHMVPSKYRECAVRFNSFCYASSEHCEDSEYAAFVREQVAAGVPLVFSPQDPGSIDTAELLGATVLIAPHVTKDGEDTVRLVKEFIKEVGKVLPDAKIIAVPEGDSFLEYQECFMELYSLQDEIGGFGFSENAMSRIGAEFVGSEQTYPNRLHVLNKKIARYLRMGMYDTYLLELGDNAGQELAEAVGAYAGTGDLCCITGLAFAAAMDGKNLRKIGANNDYIMKDWPISVELIPAPNNPEDWEEGVVYEAETVEMGMDNMLYLNESGQAIGGVVRGAPTAADLIKVETESEA